MREVTRRAHDAIPPLDQFRHRTNLFRGLAGRVLALLAREHPVDHAARPKRAGVDVEIVERLARMLVDRALLRFEHHVILVVYALAIVDMGSLQGARELLVVGLERPDEIPEIMATRL